MARPHVTTPLPGLGTGTRRSSPRSFSHHEQRSAGQPYRLELARAARAPGSAALMRLGRSVAFPNFQSQAHRSTTYEQ